MADQQLESLFRIRNSRGQSYVEYFMSTTDRSKIVSNWVDGRTGKFKRHLNMIEKKFAYGSKIRKMGTGFELKIVSLPQRAIHVEDSDGKNLTMCKINDRKCCLIDIYVQVYTVFGLQKVSWVDIRGKDLITDEEVLERIYP